MIHIHECIARIEEYVRDGRGAFLTSTLIQDAVLRNLQVLAESSQHLSETAKAAHPEVDWRAMSGFRNILVHNYLGINLPRVWEVVEHHLPVLRQAVQALLDDRGGSTAPDEA